MKFIIFPYVLFIFQKVKKNLNEVYFCPDSFSIRQNDEDNRSKLSEKNN